MNARGVTIYITETCKRDLIDLPVEQQRLWVITLMCMLTTVVNDTGGACCTLTHPSVAEMRNFADGFPLQDANQVKAAMENGAAFAGGTELMQPVCHV